MCLKKGWFIVALFFVFLQMLCAEEMLQTLPLEQKIAQLFIIAIDNSEYLPADSELLTQSALFSNERAKKYNKSLAETLIKQYQVGGVHFIGYGTIESSLQAIGEVQALSGIPLLITQDFEWGLKMRLANGMKFPYAMTLGAIQDTHLIYQLGKEIARQCILLGVHINFAPVADIASNPLNPIINYRSFSSDKVNVATKAINLIHGLQDGGLIACAKHFCGHGDSDSDSHLALPILHHSLPDLIARELYPFQKLIAAGVKSIMTAHLHVPAIDSRENRSITLSYAAITELLQKQLGFSQLIITDALNMQAINGYFKPGEVELEAFLAGNDILLMSEDVPLAIATITKAINDGMINEAELDRRVLKILKIKEELGLFKKKVDAAMPDIRSFVTSEALALKKHLYEAAVTVVANNDSLIPIANGEKSLALIQIGGDEDSSFKNEMAIQYPYLTTFYIKKDAKQEDWESLLTSVMHYQTIVIGLFDIQKWSNLNYGISQYARNGIQSLFELNKDLIVSIFGNAYSLRLFTHVPTVIMAYEPEIESQIAAAQIIAGKIPALGRLPIMI